jgi:photosynthetic reaction center cytochrome c subunit
MSAIRGDSGARAGACAALLALAATAVTGCGDGRAESKQLGHRGLGMVQIDDPGTTEARALANVAPAVLPPVAPAGMPAAAVYQNVPLLGHEDVADFTRLMAAMTNWVSPEQGCVYCHQGADFAADGVYTKAVSRRMIEMTRHINMEWKSHVGETGVTCYTCHRGRVVPQEIWFRDEGPGQMGQFVGNRAGQNYPAPAVGLTSLPFDPFAATLTGPANLRVIANSALPRGDGASIQSTEQTYALMMHLSSSLGVNCTYCHNTRSFAAWDASTPARVTAYHGLQMVRDLNEQYLEPLAGTLPAERLGPGGDAPKVSCATCHRGVPRPLGGAAMVADYPLLTRPTPPPPAESAPAETTETAGPAAAAPAAEAPI